MAATVNILSQTLEPKEDICVLGVQIDSRLKWHAHARKTQKKMITQTLALSKITTSTWGATFAKARHIYTAVIRPAMTYGSAVWHAPPELKGLPRVVENKLSVIQNRCLRIVSGAYKATPIKALEAETVVAPIALHLQQLQAKLRYRMRSAGNTKFINKACTRIATKLQQKTGPKRAVEATPGQRKQEWAWSLGQDVSSIAAPPLLPLPPLPPKPPPWEEPSEDHHQQQSNKRLAKKAFSKKAQSIFTQQWRSMWEAYRATKSDPSASLTAGLSRKRLQIHEGLARAQSSLATQIRTEKIGFADFLHKQRVPTVTSPACPCGWHRQTAKHVIMFCPLQDLGGKGPPGSLANFNSLVNSAQGLKIVTSRLIKSGLLAQYSVAAEQLYG